MSDITNIDLQLKASVTDALKYMISGMPDLKCSSEMLDPEPADPINFVKIGIMAQSPVKFKFSLKISLGLLISLASNILEISPEEISEEEYMDTGAEILNVIAGNCAKKLVGECLGLVLGLPEKNKCYGDGGAAPIASCRMGIDHENYMIMSVFSPDE